MPAVDPLSTLVEAAKVARSFVSDIGQHVPFLLASLAVCIFLTFFPIGFFPSYFADLRWLFAGLGLFLGIYLLIAFWCARKPYKLALWHLKHLGVDEKDVLRPFLQEDKAVRYFPISHGPACSLISRGILFAAGTAPYDAMPFAMHPKILVYLRKHPGLLGLTRDQIGTMKLADERFPEETYAAENNS
jgi:hypothetical protein